MDQPPYHLDHIRRDPSWKRFRASVRIVARICWRPCTKQSRAYLVEAEGAPERIMNDFNGQRVSADLCLTTPGH
jgi:hypothetical protein